MQSPDPESSTQAARQAEEDRVDDAILEQAKLKAQEALENVLLGDDKAVDFDEGYLEQAKLKAREALENALLGDEEAEKSDEAFLEQAKFQAQEALDNARKLHF